MTQQVNIRLPQPTINRLGELAELYGSQAKAIIAAIENLHTKDIEIMRSKKMTYTINYHTGAGNFEFDGDLSDAMNQADSDAAYTQQSITIEDEDGNEIARRPWCSMLTGIEDQQNPIRFGDFGYYADWYEA